jgi:hypothetical protein
MICSTIVVVPIYFGCPLRWPRLRHARIMQAQGGPWERDLMFTVPREHPEVARLEGRYKR